MKKLIAILAIAFVGFSAQAQNTSNIYGGGVWSYQAAGDTLVASTNTGIIAVPTNSYSIQQEVSYTLALDSIGGTPALTFQPYVSNDQSHWSKVGSAVTITTHNDHSWYLLPVNGHSDTCLTVNTNPWIGRYFGFSLIATSASQRVRWYLYINSHATY